MSNPSKAKGTRWESAIAAHLRERDLPAHRVVQTGSSDVGDIHGVSPFVIQAKDRRDVLDGIREGLDAVQKQAAAAGERWGVVVAKRARKPVGEAYVVMRLDTFAELLAELHGQERRV